MDTKGNKGALIMKILLYWIFFFICISIMIFLYNKFEFMPCEDSLWIQIPLLIMCVLGTFITIYRVLFILFK